MAILIDAYIESCFPQLSAQGYKITSPATPSYNCIAWAAGDDTNWWEPDPFSIYYWPSNVPRQYTLESYIKLFNKQDYEKCQDSNLEIGYDKVAIYIDSQGAPTHAARQLNTGHWTSKLGSNKDIEHNTVDGLVSNGYGIVAVILKRKQRI